MIYHLVMYNSSPWKINPFLRTVNHGKPSISMGRLYHGYDNPKIFSTSTKGFSSHFDDILRQGTIRIATSGSMYLTAAKKGVCLRQSKHGLLDNSPLGLTIYSANNFHPMFQCQGYLSRQTNKKREGHIKAFIRSTGAAKSLMRTTGEGLRALPGGIPVTDPVCV